MRLQSARARVQLPLGGGELCPQRALADSGTAFVVSEQCADDGFHCLKRRVRRAAWGLSEQQRQETPDDVEVSRFAARRNLASRDVLSLRFLAQQLMLCMQSLKRLCPLREL